MLYLVDIRCFHTTKTQKAHLRFEIQNSRINQSNHGYETCIQATSNCSKSKSFVHAPAYKHRDRQERSALSK